MTQNHPRQRVLIAIPRRDDQKAVVIHACGKGVEQAVARHDDLGDLLARSPIWTGNRDKGRRPKPGVYIWSGNVESDMGAAGALRSWHGNIRLILPDECAALINGEGDPWYAERRGTNPQFWG